MVDGNNKNNNNNNNNDGDNNDGDNNDTAVEIVIDGTLDLHHFSPKDLGTLIPDYLAECRAQGIVSVRLIHGRGIGAVARSVHALLTRSPHVLRWSLADPGRGGRGATLVDLAP